MNENQLEALRKLRDDGRPVKLHHSTGRSLVEYGFAVRTKSGLYASTEAGVEEIDRTERVERQRVIDWSVPRETHEFRRRVTAWLELHAGLTPMAERYAAHVLNALLVGRVPVESGQDWANGSDEKIRAWVEVAIDGVEEMRAAKARAKEIGGDISVTYSADVRVESSVRARRVRAVAESLEPEGDNVVGLDRYRQERLA